MTPDDAAYIIVELGERAKDIPPKGHDFADSIMERATAIFGTISCTGRVSDNQAKALNNMSLGVEKWFHNRELNS